MLDKFRRDIRTPKQRYAFPDDLHGGELKQYYFIFSEKRVSSGADQPLISGFNENGIPVNRTYVDVKDQDHVYFPITIGQMGIAVFHTYLETKSEQDKDRFLKFAEWFSDESNMDMDEHLGVRWLTHVPLPQYNNPGPWPSAFSQSRGISILLRGYQLSGEKRYAEIAEKALESFTVPVKDGGVRSETEWGPFYEEYTAEFPTLVLNGMIFSLCGIYDFVRVFPGNIQARKIYEDGIRTLENILPQYDLGFWSKYNLCADARYPEIDPATIAYQRLHVDQLEMLYRLTEKAIFKRYADIFRRQDTFSSAVKMYRIKYSALKKIGRL
ncbi:MAG: D-glucuronyl C5-epimerase family protein [FCB group bacterium]|nr:D-glucuronyl C5-epimerase family protein [FCB group bacterium]